MRKLWTPAWKLLPNILTIYGVWCLLRDECFPSPLRDKLHLPEVIAIFPWYLFVTVGLLLWILLIVVWPNRNTKKSTNDEKNQLTQDLKTPTSLPDSFKRLNSLVDKLMLEFRDAYLAAWDSLGQYSHLAGGIDNDIGHYCKTAVCMIIDDINELSRNEFHSLTDEEKTELGKRMQLISKIIDIVKDNLDKVPSTQSIPEYIEEAFGSLRKSMLT